MFWRLIAVFFCDWQRQLFQALPYSYFCTFLYSLHTQDCKAKYNTNSIFTFADDSAVISRINNNNEMDGWNEMGNLVSWCQDNILVLDISMTKESIVDLQKQGGGWTQPCPY